MKEITSPEAVLAAAGIEPTDIQGEYVRIAALLATYNEEYAKALKEHLLKKAAKDRAYSTAYLRHRSDLLDTGEKFSEGVLKAKILTSPDYILAMERAAYAEVEKVRIGGVLDALSTKRDALISLGAHLRTEMQGNPRLRDYGDEGDSFSFDVEDDD